MTEMFGEAWSPMSVPDLAPDDDDLSLFLVFNFLNRSLQSSLKLYFKKSNIKILIQYHESEKKSGLLEVLV